MSTTAAVTRAREALQALKLMDHVPSGGEDSYNSAELADIAADLFAFWQKEISLTPPQLATLGLANMLLLGFSNHKFPAADQQTTLASVVILLSDLETSLLAADDKVVLLDDAELGLDPKFSRTLYQLLPTLDEVENIVSILKQERELEVIQEPLVRSAVYRLASTHRVLCHTLRDKPSNFDTPKDVNPYAMLGANAKLFLQKLGHARLILSNPDFYAPAISEGQRKTFIHNINSARSAIGDMITLINPGEFE